jgi:hypothetical protein
VHPDNPLTARVLVNRVWAWHFGQPLVDSPSDFGTRSQRPAHPQLLDYLATQLIESGWSLSHLHRLIVLSSTYQQSSRNRPEAQRIDPDNRLYWQFPRQRMPFEVLRDSLLAVSGRLQQRAGGVPVALAADDPQATCRTLYLQIDRQQVSAIARAFDFPSPDLTCPQRSRTVVPQQQLFLLNSPFVIAQARALADRIRPGSGGEEPSVGELFQRVLLRPPTDQERQRALDAIAGWSADPAGEANPLDAWTRLAQVLLASNEFIFID